MEVFGLTDRGVSEQVCARMRLPISVDEFERQLLDLARINLPHATEKPGAERLLQHFYEYKIPVALATNSTEQAVRLVSIARPKMFATFHHKVSVTDPEVDRGKPYPDIYLVAASRFKDKPKPAQCIVFEDSEVGVQAAVAAGMQVVMVPDPSLGRERTRQATLVLRSLRDFKPELFGLPPFNDAPPTTTVPIHHS